LTHGERSLDLHGKFEPDLAEQYRRRELYIADSLEPAGVVQQKQKGRLLFSGRPFHFKEPLDAY
jgi:hypothetical protein